MLALLVSRYSTWQNEQKRNVSLRRGLKLIISRENFSYFWLVVPNFLISVTWYLTAYWSIFVTWWTLIFRVSLPEQGLYWRIYWRTRRVALSFCHRYLPDQRHDIADGWWSHRYSHRPDILLELSGTFWSFLKRKWSVTTVIQEHKLFSFGSYLVQYFYNISLLALSFIQSDLISDHDMIKWC